MSEIEVAVFGHFHPKSPPTRRLIYTLFINIVDLKKKYLKNNINNMLLIYKNTTSYIFLYKKMLFTNRINFLKLIVRETGIIWDVPTGCRIYF